MMASFRTGSAAHVVLRRSFSLPHPSARPACAAAPVRPLHVSSLLAGPAPMSEG